MKKIMYILAVAFIILIIYISFQAGVRSEISEEAQVKELDITIKKLLAKPEENAMVVYEIPVGVKLLARTPDRKWIKTRISFNFLGHYQYEGWCRVEK